MELVKELEPVKALPQAWKSVLQPFCLLVAFAVLPPVQLSAVFAPAVSA